MGTSKCYQVNEHKTLTVHDKVERGAPCIAFNVRSRAGIRPRLMPGNTAEHQVVDIDFNIRTLHDGKILGKGENQEVKDKKMQKSTYKKQINTGKQHS